MANPPFAWAAGIENTFIPQTRPGLRALDEYDLAQHYDLWRGDLDRVAGLGITHLRWGVPWYRVQPAPDRWDWRWVDAVLDTMVTSKGLEPVLDLMHYGTPLWLEDSFLNGDYPERVADYALAFAERYRDLVRYYTPLNEPTVNAHFSGRAAVWPPYLEGDDGYVRVLMQLVRGMGRTARALRAARPDVVFVQVEALGWSWTSAPQLEARVAADREDEFLAFDLFTGRVDPAHPLWPFLETHGVRAAELEELQAASLPEGPPGSLILGTNLYPWSGGEWVLDAGGAARRVGELRGEHLADVLRGAWRRYGLPVMVTETSARRDIAGRAAWMDATIAAVRTVQAEGVPVCGYTWFPAFSMIDWDYRTGAGPLGEYLLHLGLWDADFDEDGVLQRHPTPLVERYRAHIRGAGE
ncbi:MAG TPA: family 1 glycosylhydrolase [Anaerolineales bacterium]|nr:family 1 glycosylhydrolase [Anaerolineales bacterium]